MKRKWAEEYLERVLKDAPVVVVCQSPAKAHSLRRALQRAKSVERGYSMRRKGRELAVVKVATVMQGLIEERKDVD